MSRRFFVLAIAQLSERCFESDFLKALLEFNRVPLQVINMHKLFFFNIELLTRFITRNIDIIPQWP